MHRFIVKGYWILQSQLGVDPRKMLRSILGVARYFRDYFRFKRLYGGPLEFVPCVHDWYEEAGATKNEYFWQDLLVAQKICAANPKKHVDIGSRVDGFVAHVASFREIEVFDVRPITSVVPGVVFRQADLMQPAASYEGYCDSLSCLHALEHFGLGRYGDPLDPLGFRRGIASMSRMIRRNGVFYLSVPLGSERVEFNANWVFNPITIIDEAMKHGLVLGELTLINRSGTSVLQDMAEITALSEQRYSLGVFVFKKTVIEDDKQ